MNEGKSSPVMVAGASIGLLLLLLAGMWLGTGRLPPKQTAQPAATSTTALDSASFSGPIVSMDDATNRSLQLFPASKPHAEPVVRLVSLRVLDEWRGSYGSLTNARSPAWLVGIPGEGLVIDDMFPGLYPSGSNAAPGQDSSATSIEGLYFAWSANSGSLIGQGALGTQWPQTVASIAALADESLPIVAATEVVIPTETSAP